MVEGARLESVFAGNRNEGSNPSPSAKVPRPNFLWSGQARFKFKASGRFRDHGSAPPSRRQVEAMAGYGVPEGDIACVLDLDPKTLRKRCVSSWR